MFQIHFAFIRIRIRIRNSYSPNSRHLVKFYDMLNVVSKATYVWNAFDTNICPSLSNFMYFFPYFLLLTFSVFGCLLERCAFNSISQIYIRLYIDDCVGTVQIYHISIQMMYSYTNIYIRYIYTIYVCNVHHIFVDSIGCCWFC